MKTAKTKKATSKKATTKKVTSAKKATVKRTLPKKEEKEDKHFAGVEESITGPKKGDTIIMYFNCFGLISKEKVTIIGVTKDNILIDEMWHSDKSGKEEYGKFDRKTGKCINDNTAFGASRYIDPQ